MTGGAAFFGSGADAAKGMVFVETRNLPSILKMVPVGESTSANNGGLIPSRLSPLPASPAGGPPGRINPAAMQARLGRTVYEQNCQVCHGPDLERRPWTRH